MRKVRSITLLRAVVVMLFAASFAAAERLAVLTPDASELSRKAAPACTAALNKRFAVVDGDMAEAAFRTARPETPFNMTAAQARAAADVIGVDVLVLLKAETLRRSSLERPEYYESYAVLFVIDGRTGLLADWRSGSVDAPTAAAAETTMLQRVPAGLGEVVVSLYDPSAFDRGRPKMEEISGDSDQPGLKPPIPYKRIKPEYPRTAYLYNVRATVEIEADIDETGRVTRTSVVRWAGYGLDAAVTDAVRAMNWRPAMRGGKPLPMRVLLRYNFTKVEKE